MPRNVLHLSMVPGGHLLLGPAAGSFQLASVSWSHSKHMASWSKPFWMPTASMALPFCQTSWKEIMVPPLLSGCVKSCFGNMVILYAKEFASKHWMTCSSCWLMPLLDAIASVTSWITLAGTADMASKQALLLATTFEFTSTYVCDFLV